MGGGAVRRNFQVYLIGLIDAFLFLYKKILVLEVSRYPAAPGKGLKKTRNFKKAFHSFIDTTDSIQ